MVTYRTIFFVISLSVLATAASYAYITTMEVRHSLATSEKEANLYNLPD
jgi:hypothetical protein